MSKKPLKKPVNFNPRSREGSDGLYKYQTILLPRISIHAPARGATEEGALDESAILFQSTLPRGERQ